MAEEFKSFVGIDVSETWLEVCVLPQATRRRFAQDAQGWQALAQMLAGQPVPLVVIEATGGLERPAARLLSAAESPWRWSTRGRPASSPRALVGSPRPIASMP